MLKLPEQVHVVCLGRKVDKSMYANSFNLSDVSPELDTWHNFLGGSAGTFSIGRLLKAQPSVYAAGDKIVLMQYRKFVSRIQMGSPCKDYPMMYLIPENNGRQVDLNQVFATYNTQFLYPHPVDMESYIGHYKMSHKLPDFLRYFAVAVEQNVISSDECLDLFSYKTLIPGGIEFGVYPIEVFIDLISKLDGVCMEFLKYNRPVSLDLYNRRALAFCNERLGSYLLIKHLKKLFPESPPIEFTGYMHTVINGEKYMGGLA